MDGWIGLMDERMEQSGQGHTPQRSRAVQTLDTLVHPDSMALLP